MDCCKCEYPTHTIRELATGAFSCDNCDKFIACQRHNGNNPSLAEFIEDGKYVCSQCAMRKHKRWSMVYALGEPGSHTRWRKLERQSNETVFRL